jgi:hypothetical protein
VSKLYLFTSAKNCLAIWTLLFFPSKLREEYSAHHAIQTKHPGSNGGAFLAKKSESCQGPQVIFPGNFNFLTRHLIIVGMFSPYKFRFLFIIRMKKM